LISRNDSVDLSGVFEQFTNPAFVLEHGVPVVDGEKKTLVIGTVIETESVGTITLASSFVEGSDLPKVLPHLVLTKEQILAIRKEIKQFRYDLRKNRPNGKGMYVYWPTKKIFEEIVSV
jgi:hypothetical protein